MILEQCIHSDYKFLIVEVAKLVEREQQEHKSEAEEQLEEARKVHAVLKSEIEGLQIQLKQQQYRYKCLEEINEAQADQINDQRKNNNKAAELGLQNEKRLQKLVTDCRL